MAKKILLALTLSALLGCGSLSTFNPVNPPAVKASGILPNCDANGACAATQIHAWGYCQYSTYQTAKTFVVALEIGMNSNAPANDMSICWIPFALGGGIVKSIDGNTNYTASVNQPSANLGSMWMDIRSCATLACNYPQDQEHLGSHKYTIKGAPQSVPLHGAFANGIPTTAFMFVWNDDLANAKPVTINVDFSGTFQQ